MKHAIIVGHPDEASFTLAMAKRYQETVSSLNQMSIIRDLYRLDFDPRLQRAELPTRENWAPAADVETERALIGDADVFAFIYPFWFNTPPAIIKGYIERVFGVGFGYENLTGGGQNPLLTDRHLIHVTSSGSTNAWLNEQGAWLSMHNLFETYLARICGMRMRPHIHFDAIVPGLSERWISVNLATLESKVRECFAEGSLS